MRKNVASQSIGAQMISVTDGSDVTTGTTTVYVTGDGGTQATTGAAVHEGQGYWSYTPSQAETNFAHVAFTFSNAAAITASVQVYPVAYNPGDAAALGLTNLDATVSSRLATAGYTAPPTAAAIRADLDASSSKLANLDAAVTSRMATFTYTAPPTAAAIRADLDASSAKLANLDATVSSRLADADYLTPPTPVENADALLKRDWNAVSGEAARSALNAFRAIRNKVSRAGAVMTVTKEDDATTAWTAALTTTPAAEPITGVDPTT